MPPKKGCRPLINLFKQSKEFREAYNLWKKSRNKGVPIVNRIDEAFVDSIVIPIDNKMSKNDTSQRKKALKKSHSRHRLAPNHDHSIEPIVNSVKKTSIKQLAEYLGLLEDEEKPKWEWENVTKKVKISRKSNNPKIEAKISPKNKRRLNPTTTPAPKHIQGYCPKCDNKDAILRFNRQLGFISLTYRCNKCNSPINLKWDDMKFPENYRPPPTLIFNCPRPY